MWKKPKIIVIKIEELADYINFCASGNSGFIPASITLPKAFM
jgi:hypothetical protein